MGHYQEQYDNANRKTRKITINREEPIADRKETVTSVRTINWVSDSGGHSLIARESNYLSVLDHLNSILNSENKGCRNERRIYRTVSGKLVYFDNTIKMTESGLNVNFKMGEDNIFCNTHIFDNNTKLVIRILYGKYNEVYKLLGNYRKEQGEHILPPANEIAIGKEISWFPPSFTPPHERKKNREVKYYCKVNTVNDLHAYTSFTTSLIAGSYHTKISDDPLDYICDSFVVDDLNPANFLPDVTEYLNPDEFIQTNRDLFKVVLKPTLNDDKTIKCVTLFIVRLRADKLNEMQMRDIGYYNDNGLLFKDKESAERRIEVLMDRLLFMRIPARRFTP